MGGGKKKLGQWVAAGYRDIRDVPSIKISSETQQRIHRVTLGGVAELLPGARIFVEELVYPRFYLDFETIGPAIPVWPGTRPYQTLPFQWSCHIERAPGVMEHAEFLDLSGEPPMRALAGQMIKALEDEGPVLMYTSYERQVIQGLAKMLPDLAGALQQIEKRLVGKQNAFIEQIRFFAHGDANLEKSHAGLDLLRRIVPDGFHHPPGRSDGEKWWPIRRKVCRMHTNHAVSFHHPFVVGKLICWQPGGTSSRTNCLPSSTYLVSR